MEPFMRSKSTGIPGSCSIADIRPNHEVYIYSHSDVTFSKGDLRCQFMKEKTPVKNLTDANSTL